MERAMAAAAEVRSTTSPNPWVGCVVLDRDGRLVGVGATDPPGGPHAEVNALRAAGDDAHGGTVVCTLEPCAHHGRTPPCVDALVAAGVSRVVVGVVDPDVQVGGRGIDALRRAGMDVAVGCAREGVEAQLAPYLAHRRTGRPWVVLKLAATVDGRIAAPDGTSSWITGAAAREDVQRLRQESDAVLVGAGTVRTDDPLLTVRGVDGTPAPRQPLRVVLGTVPEGVRVAPALALGGDLHDVLTELGRRQVLQVLVEGGAAVAHGFHGAGLVNRYVVYMAPAIFGGDDAVPMFAGAGASTMAALWRGRLVDVRRIGDDVRMDIEPTRAAPHDRKAA